MPEGWTRWVFDQHGLVYDTVRDARVREGDLEQDYDVILFQSQAAGVHPGRVCGRGASHRSTQVAWVRQGSGRFRPSFETEEGWWR